MKKKIISCFLLGLLSINCTEPIIVLSTEISSSDSSTSSTTNASSNDSSTSSTTNASSSDSSTSSTTNTSGSDSSTSSTTNTSSSDSSISSTTSTSSSDSSTSSTTSTSSSDSSTSSTSSNNVTTESTSKKKTTVNNKQDNQKKKRDKKEYNTEIVSSDLTMIKNQTTEEFIESIGDKARDIGQEYDLYASVMIAQAILETGSGSSELSQPPNYNLFGIKGNYKNKSVSFNTSEDDGSGKLYITRANFRKYPGYKESFEDYATLLTDTKNGNGDVYHKAWKKNAKSYKEATKALTGKYATDINYDKKLNKLIETYDLTFFDSKLTGDHSIQYIYYDVKKGDSIQSVIDKHQISEENFKKWNAKWFETQKELKEDQQVIVGQRKLTSFKIQNTKTKKEGTFIIPLNKGYTITSPFGLRGGENHNGIDLAVPNNTIIYASAKGEVVAKGYDPSAGNYVILKHENGLFTSYFHMNRSSVSLNESVEMGDMIGYVGSTGNSTGPHLHFAINLNLWSDYINPEKYMQFNLISIE